MPRARIVFAEDGRGDSRDARILHALLSKEKWDVEMGEPTGEHLDAQFFISGALPPGMKVAPAERNVAVAGRLDDFAGCGGPYMSNFWLQRVRSEFKQPQRMTALGWTSFDMYDADVPRERSFFHCAGQSSRKGTQTIVRAWQPEWPQLVIVASPAPWWEGDPECAWIDDEERLGNVRVIVGKLADGHLRELMNRSAFHIYPMREDDLTRTILEGLSCGSVVVAPPQDMTVEDVKTAVKMAMGLSDERLGQQCAISRALWQETNEAFLARGAAALEALCEPSP